MADLEAIRRYLRQQAELGGSEVVLGDRAEILTPGAARGKDLSSGDEIRSAEGDNGTGDVVAEENDMAKGKPKKPAGAAKAASTSGDGKWRKGAPPIPGPGIAVVPPEPTLLGNDLHLLKSLDAVAERIRTSYCCELCPHRTNAVPGEGNPKARLVLVGEAPGATEDATGRPFVGQAGQLLDSILEAIELPRETVFITNIVKCRPPQNRKPLPDEVAACMPYLHRQLELIRPEVILALGGTAAESLLGVKKTLGELRNKVHTYGGIPLVVTYHPAALLRNPNWKKPTWDDVRIARQLLDR